MLDASQMQRNDLIVKTATFPSLRVDADLREAAEAVLGEGETLSALIVLLRNSPSTPWWQRSKAI
jgi:hypothetical protein